MAFNTANAALDRQVEIDVGETVTTSAVTGCAARASAPGSLDVTPAPLGFAVHRIGTAR